MKEANIRGRIVLEPEARGTAAAVIMSALLADPEDLVVVAPS